MLQCILIESWIFGPTSLRHRVCLPRKTFVEVFAMLNSWIRVASWYVSFFINTVETKTLK